MKKVNLTFITEEAFKAIKAKLPKGSYRKIAQKLGLTEAYVCSSFNRVLNPPTKAMIETAVTIIEEARKAREEYSQQILNKIA